jgi:hypothetical protein
MSYFFTPSLTPSFTPSIQPSLAASIPKYGTPSVLKVLKLINTGDVSFYNDNKQIVVFNNNYTNNGYRNDTTYIGGGLPEDNSAIGYGITGPGVPPNTVITSYGARSSNPSSMYNVFFIDLNNPVTGNIFYYKSDPDKILTYVEFNGMKVFADYNINVIIKNYYGIYKIYPGGDTKFNSDLINEISTDLQISPVRVSIISLSQENSTDLSINFNINNNIPISNHKPNDFFSSKCLYDLFTAQMNKTTPKACDSMLPSSFVNVDDDEEEYFTEETNILSGDLTVSGSAVTPKNPVPKPTKPTKILDYLFTGAYLFAIIGSIIYGIAGVTNIDISTIFVNRNVSFCVNLYVGLCGIISIFYWYQIQNPFNNIIDENVIITKA